MAKTNLRLVDIQYESEQPWFNNDRWTAEDIGLEPDIAHSTYYIKFCYFSQPWFKRAIKRFVLLQSATKSFSSCKSYAVNLAHFSRFLEDSYPSLQPHEINRKIIIDYLNYLNICGFSVSTRSVAITHFKTFHTIMLQEKWLPLPFEPLIHNSDTPKSEHGIPRYIPEDVIKQLKQHLTCLPQHMKNFITVLLETGRRISEICAMPYDCLERDSSDGFFLRIHDKKLRKQYLIPISVECVNTIKEQQNIAITIAQRKQPENTPLPKYLFPSVSPLDKRGLYMRARQVNDALNLLASQKNIVDENAMIWHFHAHQFRHTLGTKMINTGVPQAIVQRYLGHASPEMTARYAYIHHDTLKKSFQQFQSSLIDAQGTSRPISLDQQDAFLLKQHIMSQALPNGLCALPLIQQRCPHANACLTCTHFRTHKGFLPQHEVQLQETNKIIEMAQTNGWQRQAEMNLNVKENLEIIINRLKQEPEHE